MPQQWTSVLNIYNQIFQMRYSTFFQVKRLKIVKTLPVNKMFPSPAHDTIFLIFEAGKNLAEKILAL